MRRAPSRTARTSTPSICITAASLLLAAAASAAPAPIITEKNRPALEEFERLRARVYDDDARLGRVRDAAVRVLRTLPAAGPKDAVRNVLLFMKSNLKYAPEWPAPRGPHEWTARQALAYGSFNGCVEAAKVFFDLYRRAYPAFPALAIGSFNSKGPDEGGHAVVEVQDRDGSVFLVDTASFERLPRGLAPGVSLRRLSAEEIRRSLDIRPEVRGAVVQVPGDSDIFIEEVDGGYRVSHFEYQRLFNGMKLKEVRFKTLDEVNAYLAGFEKADVSFEDLAKLGLILRYDGPDKAGFEYVGSRHVVFSCEADPDAKDDSETVEPRARKQYEKTGRAGTCVRTPTAPAARP